MTRWERFKFWAGFLSVITLVGILTTLIVPDTGDCFYFSQHATDC